jgi:DUF2905 family protein
MTPFDLSNLGKFLLIGAVVLAIVGIVLMVLGNMPFFGRLPGDIAIQRNGNIVVSTQTWAIYAPLAP